jgi:hypothetical protein
VSYIYVYIFYNPSCRVPPNCFPARNAVFWIFSLQINAAHSFRSYSACTEGYVQCLLLFFPLSRVGGCLRIFFVLLCRLVICWLKIFELWKIKAAVWAMENKGNTAFQITFNFLPERMMKFEMHARFIRKYLLRRWSFNFMIAIIAMVLSQ